MNEKPWYLSRAIWGAVISIIAGIAATFGYNVDVASQEQIAAQVVAMGGAGLALYGRISATTRLK